jgi:hypothetical protein
MWKMCLEISPQKGLEHDVAVYAIVGAVGLKTPDYRHKWLPLPVVV